MTTKKRKWTYGDEGTKYRVSEGEVWACGKHIFVCSDIMDSDLFDRTLHDRSFNLLYSDPPWGTGLLNGFRTKAGKDRATHTWQELYRRVANLGHAAKVPVWMECSVIENRDGKQVPDAIRHPSGFSEYDAYWQVVYYRKNPSGLFHSGIRPVPETLVDLTGMDDDFTPGAVMASYDLLDAKVIDPCAGRGVTSRQAEEQGWGSINNEMHPARVSAALSRMNEMIGVVPVRIA